MHPPPPPPPAPPPTHVPSDKPAFGCFPGKTAAVDVMVETPPPAPPPEVKFGMLYYSANWWSHNGYWMPLKHHGVILKSSAKPSKFLTLDYGRDHITWEVNDKMPGFPLWTCDLKAYRIDLSIDDLIKFCRETPAFHWYNHDCQICTQKLLKDICHIDQSTPKLLEKSANPWNMEFQISYGDDKPAAAPVKQEDSGVEPNSESQGAAA